MVKNVYGIGMSTIINTYTIINHLYVDTDFIMKIWEVESLPFNNIWEDPIVTNLKFSSWRN